MTIDKLINILVTIMRFEMMVAIGWLLGRSGSSTSMIVRTRECFDFC
jgi:hypothetical protein